LKIVIISGSNRRNSQSIRISNILFQKLSFLNINVSLVNLEKENFPFWQDDYDNLVSPHKKAFEKTSLLLKDAEGFIFVVPEWGGMVPSQVKNIFLLSSNNELAHKPGLIVSLSESMGGAYPIAELRSFSYKNTKICWIPEHVIIRKVKEFFPDTDERLDSRLDYSCKMLVEYSKALKPVRNVADLKTFKNGM
jgi:NAD(P)H-dependent FMN reductase